MIKMMRAAAATTFAVAAAAVLAGCPSGALPGGVGPSAVPTGSGGQTCDSTAPASNTSVGTSIHGEYNGQRLPGDFASTYKTEAEITARITEFSTGNQTTWACFQTFYGGAVAVWKAKTGRN